MATEQQTLPTFKIFDLYDTTEVKIEDPGLKTTINLEPKLVLKDYGRNFQKFGQLRVNIVERLMNKLMVPGHKSRKHFKSSGRTTGKAHKAYDIVEKTFKIIEKNA